MALLVRIYFNAVFGALGGLLGWMLYGVFGDRTDANWAAQSALAGAVIGGSVGYFVVSVEAVRDRSLVRFVRLASYGAVLSLVGGAAGAVAGELVNYHLVGQLGARRDGPSGAVTLAGTVLSRGLGWMLLGVAVGLSEGVAARSLGKLSYGTLGGAVGGFVGGALFALLMEALEKSDAAYVVGQALGLMILGACIGSLSALVQGVFQPASVRVLRGWQEGREYALAKADNLLGRDEHADVALFRDMRVEKRHAFIRRKNNRYALVNNGAPAEFTRVNGATVRDTQDLADGDRIELGQVVLRFQARAAKELPKKGKPS